MELISNKKKKKKSKVKRISWNIFKRKCTNWNSMIYEISVIEKI